MRNLLDEEVNRFRDVSYEVALLYGNTGDAGSGIFLVPSKVDGRLLRVIASNGDGWDHVSVSHIRRVPNWYEMEQVKRLFFLPDEVAFQLHVAASDHVNVMPHCLHLWRHQTVPIKLPPPGMVG